MFNSIQSLSWFPLAVTSDVPVDELSIDTRLLV